MWLHAWNCCDMQMSHRKEPQKTAATGLRARGPAASRTTATAVAITGQGHREGRRCRRQRRRRRPGHPGRNGQCGEDQGQSEDRAEDKKDVVAELAFSDGPGTKVVALEGSYLPPKDGRRAVTVVVDNPVVDAGSEVRKNVRHHERGGANGQSAGVACGPDEARDDCGEHCSGAPKDDDPVLGRALERVALQQVDLALRRRRAVSNLHAANRLGGAGRGASPSRATAARDAGGRHVRHANLAISRAA
jgi:hypothetical protein